MILPLKAVGFLAGLELLSLALVLSFRARYYDGVVYPPKVPFAFFFVGAVTILTLSEVTVAAVLESITTTLLLYYAIAILGALAFVYYWVVWPGDGCLVATLQRLRDRLR